MLKVFCLIETCESEPPVVTGYTHEREALLAGLERIIDEAEAADWERPLMDYDDLEELTQNGTLSEVRDWFDKMLLVWDAVSSEWLVVDYVWVVTAGRD